MRQKRAKAYRKLMHLYCHFFGFRQPYQMLIDSETCTMAVNNKFDLVKQLETVLQGEVKPSEQPSKRQEKNHLAVSNDWRQSRSPVITQCCIHELYLQGRTLQTAVDLAKLFERRKCNHREPISGDECLLDVVGDSNKHRYVIVAQSQTLRAKFRGISAVPIVHINRSVMVLEPPSDITLRKKALAEQKLLGASTSDIALVEASQSDAPKKAKKKGPRGPNPLSVRKKKTEPPRAATKAEKPAEEATLGKRKRIENGVHGTETIADSPEPPAGDRKKKRRRRKKGPH